MNYIMVESDENIAQARKNTPDLSRMDRANAFVEFLDFLGKLPKKGAVVLVNSHYLH